MTNYVIPGVNCHDLASLLRKTQEFDVTRQERLGVPTYFYYHIEKRIAPTPDDQLSDKDEWEGEEAKTADLIITRDQENSWLELPSSGCLPFMERIAEILDEADLPSGYYNEGTEEYLDLSIEMSEEAGKDFDDDLEESLRRVFERHDSEDQ